MPAHEALTQTRIVSAEKRSSDIVHPTTKVRPAGTDWPGAGDDTRTDGTPFGGSPGSIPIRKSPAVFVSPQNAARSRIRPGPGAGTSGRIVFPGSQERVPPSEALNSTRSTTMSRPAAAAFAPSGLRKTSFTASPVRVRYVAPSGNDASPPAGTTPDRSAVGPWYVPGRSTSR